jgi:putative heme-binding domain-containing protein
VSVEKLYGRFLLLPIKWGFRLMEFVNRLQWQTLLSAMLVFSLWLTPSFRAQAQHETGSDLLGGEQAFQQFCATCHGVAGNLIQGIDLGLARFRQPYSDEQLQNIILNGIAGTPMPATAGMSPEQAQALVIFLRSRAVQSQSMAGGDADRGALLFAGKGQCYDCHRIAGRGSRLGPELTSIGTLRTAVELLASLLEPNARVLPNHRFYAVTTRDGERISGRLLNHDAFTVQMLDTDERLRSFEKAGLASHGFIDSPMPSLSDHFSEQELADLVQYLVSLRGGSNP